MKKKNWKEMIQKLLDRRGWDIKDFHRATLISQWMLQNIMQTNILDSMDEKEIEKLYQVTKGAKLDEKLMRFHLPLVIAVWAHKGGTGKTTITTNLAYELSKRGYNILVIDTDSQSNTSSVLYPIYLQNPEISFYEAFVLRDDFNNGYIQHTNYMGLDIVPGSARSEDLEKSLVPLENGIRKKLWKKCLESTYRENYYDFIIIDMDKSAGLMNRSILMEADYVLSPIESKTFAIEAVPPILAYVEDIKKENEKLEILGFLFNMVDLRKKKAFLEWKELVEQIAPGLALKNYIKNDANIDNSQKEHLPLGVYNKNSVATKQMGEVADEILNRIRNKLVKGEN